MTERKEENQIMNRSEYAKLSSPFLSHLARSMYLFAIKPNSDSTGAYSVDYATLIHRLSVYTPDTNELQYKPSTEEITAAIENLIKIQLIRLDQKPDSSHFQNAVVTVPDSVQQDNAPLDSADELTRRQRRYSMHNDWMPSPQFPGVAKSCMLINQSYTEIEIANFRAFWMARGILNNECEWDYKFVQYLKRIHTRTAHITPVYSGNIGLQNK
ncbi:MAG: hypothetical protein K5752_07550 [Succinivibrionaceae bacterium]|nr:hypothetical protein [Succinivibrionaceae bacterium]